MDKELKTKWVAALRSGEYHQGYGCLKVGEHGNALYCCLGVLHEVAGGSWDVKERTERSLIYLAEGREDFFPDGMYGLSTKVQHMFGKLNDDHVPFSEIADIIESDQEL